MEFNEQENQIHTPNITINLREHVKTWLKLDDEIKTLRGEIKKRRNLKRTMTNDLINTMKNNDIDCFDIKDGKLL